MTTEKEDLDDMLLSLGLGPDTSNVKDTPKEEPKAETKPKPVKKAATPKATDELDMEALLAENEPVKENKPEEEEVDTPAVLDDSIIEDLIEETGEKLDPMPEPVKPKRGRPAKAKTVPKTKQTETQVKASEDSSDLILDNNNESSTPVEATYFPAQRTIYIASDNQIINGHIYSKGQKITYTVGDKFYNSQTDRNGKNWLDLVDDYDAQFAYFGRIIAESGKWTGIPFGSLEGIEHPGLAAAIRKVAMEELERNGVPFN